MSISLWAMVWVSIMLLITTVGLRLLFGKITIDQLVFNIIALRAGGGSGGELVWFGILAILVLPTIITALLAMWAVKRRNKRLNTHATEGHHTRYRWSVLTVLLTAAMTITATTAFASTVKLADFVRSGENTADVGDYYTHPEITDATERRNLVIIYLESGEDTLSDESLFETNMFAPLTEATEGWTSIEGLRQYAGGGWTMAGVVSTQCGIPLMGKLVAGGSQIFQEIVDGPDHYLPGVDCLGDVLHDHGYRNVFLGGADTTFAAKNIFLDDHGYDRVKGLADWQALGLDDAHIRSDWGLSDARLMEHAKEEVSALHAESRRTGQPFNLTMLTLDTHEPAHPYDDCSVETAEEMESVYRCSMTAVAGFIDHMRAEGCLEDTAVVVMGDHLTQLGAATAFHGELADRAGRTIFNRIWVPGDAGQLSLRGDVDQFSMYPTLLEVAGFSVADHRAGIGVSAFAPAVPQGSAPALERAEYRELLRSRSSDFYRSAWD